nr:MAG TPA: hypothetical protein [Caudoviricetes sp.]
MNEPNSKVPMLTVSLDIDKNIYQVDVPKGSTVNEIAFNMAVVIRCLLKDNVIKDVTEMTDLVIKYCTDGQYDEVKEIN